MSQSTPSLTASTSASSRTVPLKDPSSKASNNLFKSSLVVSQTNTVAWEFSMAITVTSAPWFNSEEIKSSIADALPEEFADSKEITSSAETESLVGTGLLLADGVEVGTAVLEGVFDGVGEDSTQISFTHLSLAAHKLGQEPPHPSLPHSLPVQLGLQQALSLLEVKDFGTFGF